MRRIVVFAVLCSFFLLCPRASAEISFGPGLASALYSADGVAPVETLFGTVLAISPGETLWEAARLRLPDGGPVYLLCPGLPRSLKNLVLTVEGEGLLFEGELGSADWIYLGNFPRNTDQRLTFTLRVPDPLTKEAKKDWPGLHWLLTQTLPQLPPTGDTSRPELAAAAALLSAGGLTAALYFPRREARRRIQSGGR